jgi:hypothetical protein
MKRESKIIMDKKAIIIAKCKKNVVSFTNLTQERIGLTPIVQRKIFNRMKEEDTRYALLTLWIVRWDDSGGAETIQCFEPLSKEEYEPFKNTPQTYEYIFGEE